MQSSPASFNGKRYLPFPTQVKSLQIRQIREFRGHASYLSLYAFLVHWLRPSSPTALWASTICFMKASLLAFMDIPQAGQVKSTLELPLHFPVLQPGQRSSSGTPARALSICLPHPTQVNFCRQRSGRREVSCCMEDARQVQKVLDLTRDYIVSCNHVREPSKKLHRANK